MNEPKLVTYIENYIGKITSAYRNNKETKFSILRIEQTRIEDCSAAVSLGLSNFINKEIIITCKLNQLDDAKDIAAVLTEAFASGEFKADYKALIGPFGLISGTQNKTAFLLIPPIYFDEIISKYDDGSFGFIWAIPVTDNEVNFINKSGVDSFLDLIEAVDPDLTDLNRLEIV